jgi:anti-anti-sigma regulatory factor
MEVTKRQMDGTLIVDLNGPFPELKEDCILLREEIGEMLVGHSGRVIFCLRNIAVVRSIQLGVLIGAISKAELDLMSVSIVTNNEKLRSIFTVGDGMIRVFKTEQEALEVRQPKGINWWMMLAIVVTILIIVVAYKRFLSN